MVLDGGDGGDQDEGTRTSERENRKLTLPRQKIYFCKFEGALFIKCDVVCGIGLTVRPYSTDGCGSLISTYHSSTKLIKRSFDLLNFTLDVLYARRTFDTPIRIPGRSRTSVCTGCICNYNWTQFSNPLVTLQRASPGSVSEQSAKEHEVAAERSRQQMLTVSELYRPDVTVRAQARSGPRNEQRKSIGWHCGFVPSTVVLDLCIKATCETCIIELKLLLLFPTSKFYLYILSLFLFNYGLIIMVSIKICFMNSRFTVTAVGKKKLRNL
ncbi:hypothetical protein EAG_05943 [Camponotus floridanus]|uniref:Uncharacterized protein n=1 Tax=Camponotus floridanus TaxID=104421 RepID=E2AY43_CAMFO|nr:hypothetical protein EAG_05943 [Camponotus floridanus]